MKETFHQFHFNLMGYKLYKNGKRVEKYVAYWGKLSSEDILANRTPIKVEYKF